MVSKTNNKKTGDLGEAIAAKHLKSLGLEILDRNYLRKWGEIDIVALRRAQAPLGAQALRGAQAHGTAENGPKEGDQDGKTVHFVEVKSVSYETRSLLDWAVTHETWRPEELVHQFKLNQIRKAVETWVVEHSWAGDIQLDVVTVRMVPREKYAMVNYIPNVILGE